ncbi:MAG: hypothetical protein ACLQCB_11260 [Spirochaetia bacterium]
MSKEKADLLFDLSIMLGLAGDLLCLARKEPRQVPVLLGRAGKKLLDFRNREVQAAKPSLRAWPAPPPRL